MTSPRDRIRPHERLIVALDLPSAGEARRLVETLGGAATFYKVGLELFMSGDGFDLVAWLRNQGKQVFVDLKFFDVPATVARAVTSLSAHGARFATVHGNQAIMRAAAGARRNGLQILAVTALTSLDQGDLDDMGFACDVQSLVLSRARRALQAGCDGVVCSGLELPALRREADARLIVVTPGIRPVLNREPDDQKRTMTPQEAIAAGADYLVVGRPIRDAADPRAVAIDLQGQIAQALG